MPELPSHAGHWAAGPGQHSAPYSPQCDRTCKMGSWSLNSPSKITSENLHINHLQVTFQMKKKLWLPRLEHWKTDIFWQSNIVRSRSLWGRDEGPPDVHTAQAGIRGVGVRILGQIWGPQVSHHHHLKTTWLNLHIRTTDNFYTWNIDTQSFWQREKRNRSVPWFWYLHVWCVMC